MPGQHVGPTQPLTLTETRNGSITPGAACRTEREVPRHAAALDRFNPRDAGAACRTSPENHTNANPQVVSIPAMPGQHVGLEKIRHGNQKSSGSFNPRDAGAACRTKLATVTIEYFGVSIPAMPGQQVGRQALSERDDSPAVGVSIPAMPGQHVGRSPARAAMSGVNGFQSPRCRGSMSDDL